MGASSGRPDEGLYWYIPAKYFYVSFFLVFFVTFVLFFTWLATLHFMSLRGYIINWMNEVTGGLTEWRVQTPPDGVQEAVTIGGAGAASGGLYKLSPVAKARGVWKFSPIRKTSSHFIGVVQVGKGALSRILSGVYTMLNKINPFSS
ncbi:MAG: hypothetical protein ACTSUE_26345 [Promethearchaeota archaeon]